MNTDYTLSKHEADREEGGEVQSGSSDDAHCLRFARLLEKELATGEHGAVRVRGRAWQGRNGATRVYLTMAGVDGAYVELTSEDDQVYCSGVRGIDPDREVGRARRITQRNFDILTKITDSAWEAI